MSTVETATLWTHIGAGVVALLAGAGALLTQKGGRRHRRAGRVFVAAMAAVVVTTFGLLAVAHSQVRVFLSLVAVFSGYFAFAGYRALSTRGPTGGPGAVDWAAAGNVVLACVVMGAWGVLRLARGDGFGTVLVVFGVLGVAIGGSDLRRFRSGGEDQWLTLHLSRMGAAYIATASAVSAVNLAPALGVVAWLWPTAVGVPLIGYWVRKYGA